MKASELRIRNWLNGNYNGFSKDVQVYAFDHKEIQHTDEKQIPIPIENFKLIPLTEEWMEKLGAIRDKYNDLFIPVPTGVDVGLYLVNGFIQETKDCVCPMANYKHIKYVHQLQNLYFALTGEELTIKQ
jgi:hypothetical protein